MPYLPNKIKKKSKLTKTFEKFAEYINRIIGSPYWFIFSLLLVIIWLPSGIIFKLEPEIWYLMINTSTTILTFLMMALLHASQKRWEDRMEKMQQKENTNIRQIEKSTKKLAFDKQRNEEINSLH